MNVSVDLIVAPVIVGILLSMIVSLNRSMLTSRTEETVTQQLQIRANNAILVIEDEVKHLREIKSVSDSTLSFVEQTSSSAVPTDVVITKEGDNLKVTRTPSSGGSPTEQTYYLKLDSILFEETVHGTSSAPFLRVSVITKSDADERLVKTKGQKASAERQIYLKNLHIAEIFEGGS